MAAPLAAAVGRHTTAWWICAPTSRDALDGRDGRCFRRCCRWLAARDAAVQRPPASQQQGRRCRRRCRAQCPGQLQPRSEHYAPTSAAAGDCRALRAASAAQQEEHCSSRTGCRPGVRLAVILAVDSCAIAASSGLSCAPSSTTQPRRQFSQIELVSLHPSIHRSLATRSIHPLKSRPLGILHCTLAHTRSSWMAPRSPWR